MLLDIPIVQASDKVVYVDTHPPQDRMVYVTKGGQLSVHAVSKYAARPTALQHVTFYDYWAKYEHMRC